MNYTNLGTSGLRVSRICLGMMGFGSGSDRPWVIDEDAADPIVKAAVEGGVTFFDTADTYSAGASEVATGKLVPKYLSRDEAVVATKVFMPVTPGENGGGLGRKHVLSGIDASLRRLNMDYVDLYQIHRWDPRTPIEETMEALNDVVRAGKARYIGASSMFSWQFAKAQHTAETERLGQVRLHAEPLQPDLSRGGARDDPALSRPGRGLSSRGAHWPGASWPVPGPARRAPHDAFEHRPVHRLPLRAAHRLRRGRRGGRGGEGTRRATAQVALAWLLSKPGVTRPSSVRPSRGTYTMPWRPKS